MSGTFSASFMSLMVACILSNNREKEENREKMMSYLGSLLTQQVADEDFRIAKAVAKNEAKLAQEEYEKYMRATKELKEINDYRLQTVSC